MNQRIGDFIAGFRASKQNFNGGTRCDRTDAELVVDLSEQLKDYGIAESATGESPAAPAIRAAVGRVIGRVGSALTSNTEPPKNQRNK